MKNPHFSRVKELILALIFLPTFGFLCSCSSPPRPASTGSGPQAQNATATPSSTPGSTPAITMTSKQLVAADPKGQYLLIKRTLAKVASGPGPDDLGILWDCKRGREFLGVSGEELVPPFADLAYDVIYVRKSLANLQYPERLWKAQLVKFENEQLELLISEVGRPESDDSPSTKHDSAFKEQLVREVNNYRQRVSPDLPEVLDYDGCGAGEVKINLKTNPGDGRAALISVFFYELCKAQELDPDNGTLCKWWVEPTEGLMLEVSGDYFFRASWPDGVEKRGRMNFDPAQDGQTVTITKQ